MSAYHPIPVLAAGIHLEGFAHSARPVCFRATIVVPYLLSNDPPCMDLAVASTLVLVEVRIPAVLGVAHNDAMIHSLIGSDRVFAH